MSKALQWGAVLAVVAACGKSGTQSQAAPAHAEESVEVAKPKPATPPLDPTNIVSIAVGSKDHTTLVAALEAADYVTAVANPGPFTVFAPTDAAFAKLPPGTVDNLVKPDNADKLRDILKYHVTTSVYTADKLTDGMDLGMANGGHATIRITDGKASINGANIIASVRASNGVVHVIDGVLTPPPR